MIARKLDARTGGCASNYLSVYRSSIVPASTRVHTRVPSIGNQPIGELLHKLPDKLLLFVSTCETTALATPLSWHCAHGTPPDGAPRGCSISHGSCYRLAISSGFNAEQRILNTKSEFRSPIFCVTALSRACCHGGRQFAVTRRDLTSWDDLVRTTQRQQRMPTRRA